MTTTPSSRLGLVYELPRGLLEKTQVLMRDSSNHGHEAYCVWVGALENGRGRIEAVWPVAAHADVAHARVSLDDVLELSDRLAAEGWFILAQVHTHPGRAFHSPVDDQFPISNKPGFISVVIPNFGTDEMGAGWAWFILLGSGRWRQLTEREIARLFVRARHGLWSQVWKGITGLLRS
jgi:hypothetical protein